MKKADVRLPPISDITAVPFPTHCGHDEGPSRVLARLAEFEDELVGFAADARVLDHMRTHLASAFPPKAATSAVSTCGPLQTSGVNPFVHYWRIF
jgi:hypothetical protein